MDSTRVCRSRRGSLRAAVIAGGCLLCLVQIATATDADVTNAELHFPRAFSPDLPYDLAPATLGPALAQDLVAAKSQPATEELRVPRSQRLFDIFAWQTFLALNWPADASGKPDPAKTLQDAGPRVWDFWMEPSRLFKLDGSAPDAWPQSLAQATTAIERTKAAWTTGVRADQSLQAFSGPLVDQNGKWVRYQVKIDREEFDYIVANNLYNLDGQIEFSRTRTVSFPIGDATSRKRGAIELKMAWKELGPTDIPSRYYTVDGQVKNSDTGRYEPRRLGLVGMHIAMRTQSSPQWLWATFEQVDNVNGSELETGTGLDGKPHPVHANFNQPARPTVLPNALPARNAVIDASTGLPREPHADEESTGWLERSTVTPVQVTRVIPIPSATADLNREVRELLATLKGAHGTGSVFRFYELVGAQWPVFPGSAAFPSGNNSAPESIIHKTPGTMVPVYVANTTMETYFQAGVQPAGPMAQDDRLAAGVVSDTTVVFGTESCVGCHYSSGIAVGSRVVAGKKVPIFGINSNDGRTGSANYSWLLQMEAKFETAATLAPKRHDYEVDNTKEQSEPHAKEAK